MKDKLLRDDEIKRLLIQVMVVLCQRVLDGFGLPT